MTGIVIIFAALVATAGVVILVNPRAVFAILRRHEEGPVIHVLAVVVRLLIGALLITNSD